MKNFDKLTEIRYSKIGNENEWTWIAKDTGSWEGPQDDWNNNHSIKYFKYLKNFNTVITAGANQGMYARNYAEVFNKVYAFEPNSVCFHCLVNNCQFENVIKIQSALGDYNGFIGMEDFIVLNDKGDLNTGGIKVKNNGIIPILTIDSFNFENVDLIQLDTEEFEYNVILGGIETIKKFHPVLILETVSIDLFYLLTKLKYKNIDKSASDSIWIYDN